MLINKKYPTIQLQAIHFTFDVVGENTEIYEVFSIKFAFAIRNFK